MTVKEYPFYLKSTVILFGLTLLSYALYHMKGIVSPMAFALIIAILLNPLVNRLQRQKAPRVAGILLSILLTIILLSGVLYFLSSQLARFSDTLPTFQAKFNQQLAELQKWLQYEMGFSIKRQVQLLNDASTAGKAMATKAVGDALGTIGLVLLVPVYVFLFLFYKPLMLQFLYDVFADEVSDRVAEVLSQTKLAIQSYMVGLLLEAMAVASLNSAALLMLGVPYAVLLGVIGALLNMIPYIGGIIAIALPVLMATVSTDGVSTQLGIIGAYAVIQFIDNNILVPRLVSSKVEINALFSIVVVFLGGALWGVAGMFLSIPFVAIIKIVFDRIPEMKPWGKLLGDEVPTVKKPIFRRRKKKDSVAEKLVQKA